jgi:hypothetical protein
LKTYFLATLKVLVAVFVALDLLVTTTETLYSVPAANVPVEIAMLAVDDSTVLLSNKKLSASFLVVRSTFTPAPGTLDETLTLNVYVPELADAVAVPGSGSMVNAIFSSVMTTGGGTGVGVTGFLQELFILALNNIALKKITFLII